MSSERIIRRADPYTIQNKVIVGYQGWFTCAGDGPPVHQGHHGWLHWFDKPLTEGGHPNFDLFPDVTEYSAEELYPVPGLTVTTPNGQKQPAKLFSSRNPKTVQRHFHWMAQHGIDGVFLQRFANQCEVDGNTNGATADLMRLRDEVLDRVREAAERENRVWAIMYDVTGVPPDRIEYVLRVDWEHLMGDKRILDSPYYLRERGMPVVAIWGFGFVESHHDPTVVAQVARHLKSVTPGGAYLWAGIPSQWRTLSGDMDPNPVFLDVFKNEFDALSPWTIGRYSKLDDIDKFCEERMRGDFKELKDKPHRIDYFPTIWPGGSSYNLSGGRQPLNDAPRQGGKFFWRQLWNVKHLGARTAYIAMFDECDEGTAVLPAVPLKRSLPTCTDPYRQYPFIALDADGVDNLMPDWYLRICGFAGEVMRDERRVYEELPKKELDDYWATRPKYEDPAGGSGSASSSGGYRASSSSSASATVALQNSEAQPSAGSGGSSSAPLRAPVRQNTGAWGAFGLDGDDGPPPYTLEADETPQQATATAPAVTPSAPATQQQNPVSSTNTSTAGTTAVAGPGVHRASSYAASSSHAYNQSQGQGATGLGRATTYTASNSNPSSSSSLPRPTFAPPSAPPPNRTSSPLHPPSRPPVHPASPMASSALPGHSPSSSGSSLPYLRYDGGGRPGTFTPNSPPRMSPAILNNPLPGGASPRPASTPLPPGGFSVGGTGVSPSTHPSTYPPTQTTPKPPLPQPTTYNPATMSYNPTNAPYNPGAATPSSSGTTPYNPATMSYNPASSLYNPAAGASANPTTTTPAATPYNPATMSYNPAATPYNPAATAPSNPVSAPYDPATMSYNPAATSYSPAAAAPSNPVSAPYDPATMSYNPAASLYTPGATPGTPSAGTPSWNNTSAQGPASTSGYFNAGTSTSYGAGNATGAHSSGIVSNPTWSTGPSPQPTAWPNNPSSYPASSPPTIPSPNTAPGFTPPMHAPPQSPPPSSSSSYPGGPPSFPPQNWTSSYPAAGPSSGPPTPFGGAGYPPPASGPYNAPALPPRPNAPDGQPGGFIAPQNKFLGGFVKQATGVVDRVAGESTRIQLEKGVMSVAETGSMLFGKLTKKP